MTNQTRYSLPAEVVQAIVNVLNDQPARVTRGVLNAIEAECLQQDQARAVQTPAPRPAKSKRTPQAPTN